MTSYQSPEDRNKANFRVFMYIKLSKNILHCLMYICIELQKIKHLNIRAVQFFR
jgi:hypothetical protein